MLKIYLDKNTIQAMSTEEEKKKSNVVVSTFVDKQGNLHEGMPWVITDSEGVDHNMYREAMTGKLFPAEEQSGDKDTNTKE